ncbi:MAG: transposase [Verrucomicrobiota bacterium]
MVAKEVGVHQPTLNRWWKRYHSSLISAVNKHGKMDWIPLTKTFDSDIFLRFLRQMIKFLKRKVYLVVDNLRVHHSKAIKGWLEKNKHRIEQIFMPSYSPELNPDEYLNTIPREPSPSGSGNQLE